MRHYFFKFLTVSMVFIPALFLNLQAQTLNKSVGVGLRGSFYHMANQSSEVVIRGDCDHSVVNVGGFGGWIYLFSRLNDNLYFDLTLGAVGKVESQTHTFHEDDVLVSTVSPLLFGAHYDLLPITSKQIMRPYVSAGGGPYWLSEVNVVERPFDQEDEVRVKSSVKAGMYAGGGLNFILTDLIGLNFDLKYHFVDFDVSNNNSGFEYGIGIHFMWGDYQ